MGRYEDVDLTDSVKKDRRTQLESIRDFLTHELEGNRCNSCRMSQLRTGDTAALVLRLMVVLAEIEALPREDGVVTRLELIRGSVATRTPDSKNPAPSPERRNSGA